jgi:hypothetical protein
MVDLCFDAVTDQHPSYFMGFWRKLWGILYDHKNHGITRFNVTIYDSIYIFGRIRHLQELHREILEMALDGTYSQ